MKKKYILTSAFFTTVSLFTIAFSLLCSSFSNCRVESIALTIDNYINQSRNKYVLSEVVSSSVDPQEDFFDTNAIAYLNYAFFWNFPSGPQNKVFRKFTPSVDFIPLSICINDSVFSPRVMSSTYAKEIKGDYFGFELLYGHEWESIDDSNSLFITEKLATSISDCLGIKVEKLIDYEVECECTSTKGIKNRMAKKIVGIISNEHIGTVNDIMGDSFVYIQSSSNYYLREICNQTICTLFKNNIVANRTCLRLYLNFEHYKKCSIKFYNQNIDTKSFSLGSVQDEYLKSTDHYLFLNPIILPIVLIFSFAFLILLFLILKKYIFSISLFNKIGFAVFHILFVLLPLLILRILGKIKLNGFFLPLYNSSFLLSIIVLIFLGCLAGFLFSKNKRSEERIDCSWEVINI